MASLAIKHSWCVLFCTRIGHYTYIANYDIPRDVRCKNSYTRGATFSAIQNPSTDIKYRNDRR